MSFLWKTCSAADTYTKTLSLLPESLNWPACQSIIHMAARNAPPNYDDLTEPERDGELYQWLLVAEKEIEQFTAPELPIIEDAFCITHQQAAKADNARSPRVVLQTILEHISRPEGGFIEEVMEEAQEKEEEELNQQWGALNQLSGIGDAAGADRARDGSPMGDRPTTQETRSRIDLQSQG
jgi:hypothetical protein